MADYSRFKNLDWGAGIDTPEGQSIIESNAKPKKKKEGGLLSLLPLVLGTAGGVGGGVVGALAGGVGAIPGAAAGGAGGSAIGEALRQRLQTPDEDVDLGRIAGEGALGAAPSVISGGIKAVKGARAAKAATEAGKAGTATPSSLLNKVRTNTGSNQEEVGNKVSQTLRNFAQGQRQTVVNPKVPASVGGAQKEAEIAQTIDDLVPGMTASKKYENLQPTMDRLGGQVDEALAVNPGRVKTADVTTRINNAIDDDINFIPGIPAMDKARDKVVQKVLNQASKEGDGLTMTAKDLVQAKRALGKDLSKAFTKAEKGQPLTEPETVAMAAWRSLDDAITEAAPGVKELTRTQSKLMQAAPGLKSAANEKTNIPIPFVQAQSQKLSEGVQGARSVAASAADKAAGAIEGTGKSGNIMNTLKSFIGQDIPRELVGAESAASRALMPQGEAEPAALDAQLGELGMEDMQALEGEQEQSLFSNEALQAMALEDIAATGGKNLGQIATLQKMFGAEASGGSGGKVGATAKKESNTAKSAMRSINDIEAILAKDSSTPLKGAIANLGGSFGRNALGTAEYEAGVSNALDALIRLRTGAAATRDELKSLRPQLPQAGDSSEVQQYKLKRFKQLLNDAIEAGSGGAASDLEALAMQ